MSFIIEQKIKGHIYLYEVDSYWDPTKGQSRKRRRCLGKKDPKTGEAVTPRKSIVPKDALDFGQLYLLRKVAEQIGLTAILRAVFPDDWLSILYLALFKATQVLDCMNAWFCNNTTLNLCQGRV